MKIPQLTIVSLMMFLSVFSVNLSLFVWIHNRIHNNENNKRIDMIRGAIIMVDILVFAIYRVVRNSMRFSSYLKGFVIFGVISLIIFVTVCNCLQVFISKYIEVVLCPLLKPYDTYVQPLVESSAYVYAFECIYSLLLSSLISLIDALPQVCFALTGGWLFNRRSKRGERGHSDSLRRSPPSSIHTIVEKKSTK